MMCMQRPLVRKFYEHAHTYFILVTVILSLQFTVGMLYLWKCGLADAVDEGVDQLQQEALIREARSERENHRNSRRE